MNLLTNNSLWSILPDFDLIALYNLQKSADKLAAISNSAYGSTKKDRVAILPLQGVVVQKECWLTKYGYATATETFGKWFDIANSDESISKIIIDCNSPGGSTYGVQELAEKIRTQKTKPVITIVNSLCASAAYWICSQSDKIYCTPSGDVGSIGVYMLHADYSKMLESEGIKVSFIKAGKFKAEGNAYEQLQDETKDYLQKMVDDTYSDFVGAVAKGRNVSKSVVLKSYGEGRCLNAKESLNSGMIDGIKSYEQVIQGITKNNYSKAKAEIEILKLQ